MKRKMETVEQTFKQIEIGDPLEQFYKSEEAKRVKKRYEERRRKASQPHHDPVRDQHKNSLKILREKQGDERLSILEVRKYRERLAVGDMASERVSVSGVIDEINPLHPSSSVQFHLIDDSSVGIFVKAMYHYYDNTSQYDQDIKSLKIGDKINLVGSPMKRQDHRSSRIHMEIIALKLQKITSSLIQWLNVQNMTGSNKLMKKYKKLYNERVLSQKMYLVKPIPNRI